MCDEPNAMEAMEMDGVGAGDGKRTSSVVSAPRSNWCESLEPKVRRLGMGGVVVVGTAARRVELWVVCVED